MFKKSKLFLFKSIFYLFVFTKENMTKENLEIFFNLNILPSIQHSQNCEKIKNDLFTILEKKNEFSLNKVKCVLDKYNKAFLEIFNTMLTSPAAINPNNAYFDSIDEDLLKLLEKNVTDSEPKKEESEKEDVFKVKDDNVFATPSFDNPTATPSCNLSVSTDVLNPIVLNNFNNFQSFQPFKMVDVVYNENNENSPKKTLDIKFKKMKRENVDKKVIRTFRRFLKYEYRSQNPFITNIVNNNSFWKDFIMDNLVPPFFYQVENKKFKSFNTKYKIWLFEHKFSQNLYEIFIEKNYNFLLSSFIKKYKIENNDEEHSQLVAYLKTFPTSIGV